tara:strand:+ start:527 stop:964 length:438 start_codon:yes stop_codon:yes gene_type:complete
MMEEALVARLRATTAIRAVCSFFSGNPSGSLTARPAIDWGTRPDRSNLPAVTMQGSDAAAIYSHGGRVDLENKTVQFDCWGTSYTTAKRLARAVINELEQSATAGEIAFDPGFLIRDRDMMPEDLDGGVRVFRVSFDFSLWYKPS